MAERNRKAEYAAKYADDPAAYNARSTSWRKANPQRANQISARWREKNRERLRDYAKRWAAENPDKIRARNNNRRARQNGNGGSFSSSEWEGCFFRHGERCAHCKRLLYLNKRVRGRPKATIDRVMPLALGGRNDIANIQPSCGPCNFKKNAAHPLDFARINGRLV